MAARRRLVRAPSTPAGARCPVAASRHRTPADLPPRWKNRNARADRSAAAAAWERSAAHATGTRLFRPASALPESALLRTRSSGCTLRVRQHRQRTLALRVESKAPLGGHPGAMALDFLTMLGDELAIGVPMLVVHRCQREADASLRDKSGHQPPAMRGERAARQNRHGRGDGQQVPFRSRISSHQGACEEHDYPGSQKSLVGVARAQQPTHPSSTMSPTPNDAQNRGL